MRATNRSRSTALKSIRTVALAGATRRAQSGAVGEKSERPSPGLLHSRLTSVLEPGGADSHTTAAAVWPPAALGGRRAGIPGLEAKMTTDSGHKGVHSHKAPAHEKREPKCTCHVMLCPEAACWRDGAASKRCSGSASLSAFSHAVDRRHATDSKFTQQEMAACRPVLTPRSVRVGNAAVVLALACRVVN